MKIQTRTIEAVCLLLLAANPGPLKALDFTVSGTLEHKYEHTEVGEVTEPFTFKICFEGCKNYRIEYSGVRPKGTIGGVKKDLYVSTITAYDGQDYYKLRSGHQEGEKKQSVLSVRRSEYPFGGPWAFLPSIWMAYVQHCKVDFRLPVSRAIAPYRSSTPLPDLEVQVEGMTSSQTSPRKLVYFEDGETNGILRSGEFVNVGEDIKVPSRFELAVSANERFTGIVTNVEHSAKCNKLIPKLPQGEELKIYDMRFGNPRDALIYQVSGAWPSLSEARSTEEFREWAARNPEKVSSTWPIRAAVAVGTVVCIGIMMYVAVVRLRKTR